MGGDGLFAVAREWPASTDGGTRGNRDYRDEMDVLKDFITDKCEADPADLDLVVPTDRLYEAYSTWCFMNDEKPLAKREFGMRLGERGFTSSRLPGGKRAWRGLGLLPAV